MLMPHTRLAVPQLHSNSAEAKGWNTVSCLDLSTRISMTERQQQISSESMTKSDSSSSAAYTVHDSFPFPPILKPRTDDSVEYITVGPVSSTSSQSDGLPQLPSLGNASAQESTLTSSSSSSSLDTIEEGPHHHPPQLKLHPKISKIGFKVESHFIRPNKVSMDIDASDNVTMWDDDNMSSEEELDAIFSHRDRRFEHSSDR